MDFGTNKTTTIAFPVLTFLIDERQITEQMKTQNQMAWVGEMNTIHNATEEVINAEIIYA